MSVESPALTRRQAITAATAAAIIPTSATATPIDPHFAWLEEWRALTAQVDDDSECDDDLHDLIREIADRIEATPAVTPQGLIAKLEFFRESNFCFEDCYVSPVQANAAIDEAVHFLEAQS